MTGAAWKPRYRAPRFTFPQWARDAPHRVTKQVAMEIDCIARNLGTTPAVA